MSDEENSCSSYRLHLHPGEEPLRGAEVVLLLVIGAVYLAYNTSVWERLVDLCLCLLFFPCDLLKIAYVKRVKDKCYKILCMSPLKC